MTDPTRPNLEDRKDRFARSELTAAEARQLAQESLSDAELFEDLTFSALAKEALTSPSVRKQLKQPDSGAKVVRFPRKARVFLAGAAAAAAIVFVSISLRSSFLRQNRTSLAQNPSGLSAPPPSLKPALASTAKLGQPVLLASSLLAELGHRDGAQVFRSPEPESRSPQSAGSIISIADGLATVDLGSLDGLTKGSEVQVFRDEHSSQPIGRLAVTTVFRERARGRILDGQQIEVHNQVRVAAALHLGALLQRVDALSSRGDWAGARTMAENAAGWAQAEKVPPAGRREALERLAGLEYHAGAYEAAEKHYQMAADSLNASPATSDRGQAAIFNNLAVLHLLRGDYDGAEMPLNRAVSKSSKAGSMYGQSVNNLAVLAELRGDRRKAEALYSDALRAFAGVGESSGQERRAVETNLARLKSSR
jgi:tetratricopeptide (TPR) repeat protein